MRSMFRRKLCEVPAVSIVIDSILTCPIQKVKKAELSFGSVGWYMGLAYAGSAFLSLQFSEAGDAITKRLTKTFLPRAINNSVLHFMLMFMNPTSLGRCSEAGQKVRYTGRIVPRGGGLA